MQYSVYFLLLMNKYWIFYKNLIGWPSKVFVIYIYMCVCVCVCVCVRNYITSFHCVKKSMSKISVFHHLSLSACIYICPCIYLLQLVHTKLSCWYLFLWHNTFLVLTNSKVFIEEEQQWYYLTYSLVIRGFTPFPSVLVQNWT